MRAAQDEVLPDGSAEIGWIFPARRQARATMAELLDCSPTRRPSFRTPPCMQRTDARAATIRATAAWGSPAVGA
jgi:hypothetical protein